MSFSKLGLSLSTLKIVEKQGYKNAYPIQKEAIPIILNGADVLAIAQTGSGKTDAFLLPIIDKLSQEKYIKSRLIKALIIVPTRELAVQIGDLLHIYCNTIGNKLRSLAVYGGVSINPQMKALFGVDILVATPGRLLDLVESNAMELSGLRYFVLDEADKMLNMGFEKEMQSIFKLLPKNRQSLLFSATLSEEVQTLHKELLNNPAVIKIELEPEKIELIDQIGYFVSEEQKGPLLRHILKNHDAKQVLVFASSTAKCDKVAQKLVKNGILAKAIHSGKSQGNRRETLIQFKAGKLHVLVTTDLLSRGIDIQFLPLVINYELPRSPKDFIHRIGRTGRAENPGQAISLVNEAEKDHFRVIQKKLGRWVDMIDADRIDMRDV